LDCKVKQSPDDSWAEVRHAGGGSIGYRLRFEKPVPQAFHFDLDVNIGAKALNISSHIKGQHPNTKGFDRLPVGPYSDSRTHFYTSVGGTANYSIVRNFSAGLGLEPIFYYRPSDNSSFLYRKFDVPFVAKIAYNLKYVEVGITGKFGLVNLTEIPQQSGRLSEVQLSVFVPLSIPELTDHLIRGFVEPFFYRNR
jgi:hypothetical protein